MSDYSQPGTGKISVHGDGLGAPSPEQVEKRAREIAMIAERDPEDFTDADWDQARRELHGAAIPAPPEETTQNAEVVEEWEVVAPSAGHRVRARDSKTTKISGSNWWPAASRKRRHDQMVEAHREKLEQGKHLRMPDALAIPEQIHRADARFNRPAPGSDVRSSLLERFRQVRSFSQRLCETLSPEDYVVQSMPDVSPTKWHLAHTSWFFETFVLKVWMPRYRSEVPQYAYLLILITMRRATCIGAICAA